jgi:hypothetical protein
MGNRHTFATHHFRQAAQIAGGCHDRQAILRKTNRVAAAGAKMLEFCRFEIADRFCGTREREISWTENGAGASDLDLVF